MSKSNETEACVRCIHCDSLMVSVNLKHNQATITYIHCDLFNDNKHPCYCCVHFAFHPNR